MPVEIRELVIKTEVISRSAPTQAELSEEQLHQLKKQIIIECEQRFKSRLNKNGFNR